MTTRKAHVVRLFISNADGTVNKDGYVDMLRVDKWSSQLRDGAQDYQMTLSWQDDAVSGSANGQSQNATRNISFVSVSPQGAPGSVSIDVIDSLALIESGQDIKLVLQNKTIDDLGNPIPTARTVKLKRVCYAPTGADDALNAGGVVDANAYIRDEGQRDTTVTIDVEVIQKAPSVLQGDAQEIAALFDPTLFEPGGQFTQDDSPKNDDDGNPTTGIRLDWWQNIVNVAYNPKYQIIFGWKSGLGLGGTTETLTDYYQTIYGTPSNGGSYLDGGGSLPPTWHAGAPPSQTTTAQAATMASLLGSQTYTSESAAGSTAYIAVDRLLYAINSDGTIRWSADLSGMIDAVPPNFNANPGFGLVSGFSNIAGYQIVAVKGAVFFAIGYHGISAQIGDDATDNCNLFAVGYQGFDEKNGAVLSSEIINGPLIGNAFTDIHHDVHTYTCATGGIGLQAGQWKTS